MKNNYFYFFIQLAIFFLINSKLNALTFETKHIQFLKEENLIIAEDGKANLSNGNLEIEANKFIYKEDKEILESTGEGQALIKNKNTYIYFDKSLYDKKNFNLTAEGNVEIKNLDENISLKTKKISFNEKKNVISSSEDSIIKDKYLNSYKVKNFKLELETNILKLQDLEFKDKDNNIFISKIAFLNIKSGKLFAKDIELELDNKSSNEDNEYRLKGNSLTYETDKTIIKKGIFTSCKKRDGCSPWKITAKKITHNKEKREVNYNDAFLKIYDLPIMYFPKFYHPDPTVKRKSGFLAPSLASSSNSSNYINTPYFLAISDNKDMTFSPRVYSNEKFLLQSEFRQVNSSSKHHADFSFLGEKNISSKNHIFYKYYRDFKKKKFINSRLNLNIQKTSNDKYLNSEKLENDISKNKNVLENSINYELANDDISIKLNSTIYENLYKKDSDRYEFILPKIEMVKNLNKNNAINGNLRLKSNIVFRNYDTNIYERVNINNLIFNSDLKVSKFGFLNNHEFLIKNSISKNKKSKIKNKENIYLSGVYQFNTNIPLIKNNNSYQKILKPKISLRIAPNHTFNQKNEYDRLNLNNIYSIDRSSDNYGVEGGISTTYGFNYGITSKKTKNEFLNIELANNLRIKENSDLPKMNQLGQKMSNILSKAELKPNDFFSMSYSSLIKNNLEDINYENLTTQFKLSKFETIFEYTNENDNADKKSYLTNTSSIKINKFNSLKFSTRRNKKRNITEFYNLMYQYRNDCLKAAIEYKKDFYSNRQIESKENLFLKLTFIPLGESSSPNLKK